MSEYKGSIELISGLKPKNNGDFPLVEAKDVAFYENGKEVRLTEKIQQVGVSQEQKNEIIQSAVNKANENTTIAAALEDMNKNNTSVSQLERDVIDINSRLTLAEKGDNEFLRLTYNEDVSTLFLHTGDEILEDASNVISQTTVKGGGDGTAASYTLNLQQDDVKTSLTILNGQSAVINFTPILKNAADGSPADNENVSVYLYVNDALKGTYILKSNVSKPLDITEFLKVGSNNIRVKATYFETILETGQTLPVSGPARTWSFNVVNMYLTSGFSDATVKEVSKVGDYVPYTFVPVGNLEKTIHFKLDGEPIGTIVTSDSDRSKTFDIPVPGHGAYDFEVYCSGYIEGEYKESEHLTYNIMFAIAGDNTPIIRMKASSLQGQQYSTTDIYFTVYKADAVTNDVAIAVNGKIEKEFTDIGRAEEKWPYKPDDYGTKKISILYDGEEYNSLTLEIAKFPYEISPITANLDLDFNPTGRTNQDVDYNIFKNNAYDADGNEKPITWTLSDNFDWVNGGWQVDENSNTYFCIKAGTTATINYNMFADKNIILGADGALGNGKEFKLVFKTTNVANVNSTFLKCLALPQTGANEVGLEMRMHHGYIKANNNTLEIPYAEQDIVEFDFNINPAQVKDGAMVIYGTDIVPMVMSYEDGAPFLPMTYTSTETSFTQRTPVPIEIGSPDCDVHIYRMKCYNSFLTDEDVLNNYIADARSGEEMSDRFLRNQIYVNGALTPDSVAEARPDLKIIKISCPYFTAAKDEFIGNTSVEMIHKNGDPVLDNWKFSNGFHTAQGTSSSKYGDAAFNIDLLMCFDGIYKHKKILKTFEGREDEYWAIRSKFESTDGSVKVEDGTGKVGLTRTSVPTNYFNVKVNVASSENANNALLAKRFDRYLPYTSVGKKRDPFVKNTMEFINCVVFLQEYDDDLSKHREFQDKEWHFYALGNIGDSKKTDQTRTYDPDDHKEFVVEIMDNNMPNAAFQTGFMDEENPMENKYPIDAKDWKEGNSAYDSLYADPWNGKKSFEMRYEHPDVSDEQAEANIAKWNEFYEWVIISSDEEFKSQLQKWVNLPAAYYYYLFTERYTMMDNRAKNSFWHWSKLYITQAEVDEATQALKDAQSALAELQKAESPDEEAIAAAQLLVDEKQAKNDWALRYNINDTEASINEGYRFDWWDYDNDTSLGIDNSGVLRMPYGKEDIDTEIQADGSQNFYFNAANSTFYRRLRELFSVELEAAYNQSESSRCFVAEDLIAEFDNWQSEFSEALWLEDYKRKYKRTYKNASPDHLNKRYNGRKKFHRRQWERDQEGYMASKYKATSTKSGMENGQQVQRQILMRCKTPEGAVVAPNYTINLIPYSDMYLNVQFGPSYIETVRASAGQSYPIKSPFENMNDNQVAVFSGKNIQSVGDISTFYPSEGTFSPAERLKTLIIGNGTEGYSNAYLNSLTISEKNKMLEYLDIQNLSSLKTVYLQIPNLKHFFAQGSGITEAVFANNGLLEEAHLPASLSSIVANNLYYLTNLSFEGYDNLNKIVFSNCPHVDTLDIATKAKDNLSVVRLTNIDWELTNADILMKLLECSGVQADGLTPTEHAVLTGTVRVEKIRQSEIDAIRAVWSEEDLALIYEDVIPQVPINFYKEFEGEGRELLVYTMLKDTGSYLKEEEIPVDVLIESGALKKKPTSQYTFEFDHWRTSSDPDFSFDENGIYITAGMDFFGVFSQTIRRYQVAWYSDVKGGVITNEKGERAEVEVEYGQTVRYDENKFGIPKKGANINTYYIFKQWDKPTGFVEGNMQIYPVWGSAEAIPPADIESVDYSPEQIFALSQRDVNEGLGKYISDGGQITMQLGYMPNYNGKVLVGPGSELYPNAITFNGTKNEMINTGEKLFAEDKSFVLAIDCTFNAKSGSNCLVSCLSSYQGRGVQIYSNNNEAPAVAGVGTSPATAPISKYGADGTHREICVIRRIKGDPNLYVYTNDRYSLASVQETILVSQAMNLIDDELYFGGYATKTSSGSLTQSNYGVGTIHFAKLWYDDLGAEECKQICSWIQDTLTFRNCGVEYYQTAYIAPNGTVSGDANTKMSFVADNLLEEVMAFHNRTDDYTGRWMNSDLRRWMNGKLFSGVSKEWQQIISQVAITSLYGPQGSGAFQDPEDNKAITITADRFYLPAYAEIDLEAAKEETYKLELDGRSNIYSIMDSRKDRIRASKNGTVTRWYTRTPEKSHYDNQYQKSVDTYGQVTSGWWNERDPEIPNGDSTGAPSQINKKAQYGVLLAFTI